ncbi:MAG: type IV secretion system DNA-binding domain-containing protein, partial [Patescibacteria group bacterium]
PIKAAIAEASRNALTEILADVFGGRKDPKKDIANVNKFQVDELAIKTIEEKIQKPVFEANIRLIASAGKIERAEEIIGHLEGVFGQFTSSGNSFKTERAKKGGLKKLIYNFSFRNFDDGKKNILNLEELASVFHFPLPHTESPNIKWVKSGFAAPPSELPEKGLNVLGKVIFRGEEKQVSFASREDRRRHFYVVGQTGTGKTSLFREMIRQDIQNGEGVGVIDPHGELIEDILEQIPKDRVDDVVLFEPFDMERPMGLNMLEYDTPEQKDFAVQEMIAIFYKLFPPEIIGPMFEHYMRNAMLAMMADKDNPGTLVEIPRIFTDDEFMEQKLSKVTDPIVRSFWMKEWKQTTGSTKSDMLGYVVSKVGRFIENEMMRNIIGQSHSGFDLTEIINSGKIFLANLSKGQTGEVNSSLLGLILVSKIQMAAMKRTKIPEDERKDFYLYVDEFQNFTTDSIATILSEARKYRLNLTLTHQYISQLTEEIRNAVLGNVGTIGAYRVGASDAEFLEKQFEPEFSRFDLVNLDNFTLILKLMINNKVYPAFKIQTILPQKGNKDIVAPIKKLSKLKYGRPRQEVEAEIIQRSRLGI